MIFQKILQSKFLMIYFIPFILGSLTVLSFQPFNFIFINFFIIPAIFLILSYVNKRSKNIYRKKPYLKNLFFIGYFFGVGFFLTGTYWISHSLTFDENLSFLMPFAIILIPLFLGVFFGFGALISGTLIQNNFTSVLLFCSSFAFVDFLRSKLFSGFPWNLWAYSWSWFPEMLQILNPIGLFAFNLLALTSFCIPLIFFFKKLNYKYLLIFSLTLLLFLNYIYGSFSLNHKSHNNLVPSINVKVVSPSFDLKYNLTEKEIEELIVKLIRYSEPVKDKQTIFVWPEGVFSGYNFNDLKKYKRLFNESFSENHKIIFGINTLNESTNKYFNSLLVVDHNFRVLYQYNKIKLVPFGEFIPFEDFLRKFNLKKVTQGYESFSKGKFENYFSAGHFKILPLICYEIIFPELTQKSNEKGKIIVNISEDAWFGNSIGPHQHFAKAIFRAIESNAYVARSANRGISAFIDNKGNILKRLEPHETGNIELNIPLVSHSSKNKNDLIFFILLFTYILIFFTIKNNKK
ncbi:MAG: apolipoprotein N-acyltransferase [Pelagibacterales bacterium]|jgi:apolipoprotein N-acyltransferase|nr:apolipoprotein N-acyltransferase [Pelagibacterales bacterium]